MSETQLQTKIIDVLHMNGWYTIRNRSVSPDGIPDLLAIKDGEVLFLEVKSPGKKATKLQQHRMAELTASGAHCFIIDSMKGLLEVI